MAFLSESGNQGSGNSPGSGGNNNAMMFMEPAKNDSIELTDSNKNNDAFGSMPAPNKSAEFAPASESQVQNNPSNEEVLKAMRNMTDEQVF